MLVRCTKPVNPYLVGEVQALVDDMAQIVHSYQTRESTSPPQVGACN
jgi:hypothetical protein